VIAMVKKRLPESVIVSAIQTGPANFNTSTNELIRLNAAGVTERELNAIMAASGSGAAKASAPDSGRNAEADEAPVSKSRMPHASVAQGNSSQEMKLEKTQLGMASHMNSGVGSSTVQEAGSIFTSMMSHRTSTVTYVWGVPTPASSNVLQSSKPIFSVDFSRTPGVNADDYEPAIVKLTPAQNTCRIIGATQGKADVRSSPAADWQIYSHFLEERVAATPQKLGPGKYKIAASTELMPGEYGLVLRPVSKGKKFSGGDVARAQGDGLMFDAIWTFQISEESQ
jgi:hypothetical protein